MYVISSQDCKDKELENMSFENIEGMTEKESLATCIRDNVKITYVDIYTCQYPFYRYMLTWKRNVCCFNLFKCVSQNNNCS